MCHGVFTEDLTNNILRAFYAAMTSSGSRLMKFKCGTELFEKLGLYSITSLIVTNCFRETAVSINAILLFPVLPYV